MTKQTVLQAIKIFLMVMGVIFSAMILAMIIIIAWFLIAKPFSSDIYVIDDSKDGTVTSSEFDHSLLNTKQETFLKSVGINPADVPTTISQEQADCAVSKLGQARVDEIVAGATPVLPDLLKAGSCFK